MTFIANFIIGFLAAFVGVIPPGLLNMSAAKISMKEGRKKGLLFSIGVCVTVMIQTYVALIFARFLDQHPEYVDFLQKVALGIFICITIYFLFIAKDTGRPIPQDMNRSKTNRFFAGMLLAVLNLLPLPYWVYISITFSGFGWFTFEQPGIWAAVLASGLGTFAMLIVYVQFFRRKEEKPRANLNMNYIIGFITAVISIITFVKILNDF
ncbi:MAG: lysine transporter LysE [Bacteroidia bacterium]|nr:lysine transporter LysE [Bacteroidia bacterium]NNF32097.1 lysine transporter LysE [Flavobacteriaceae bacterium]MBT8275136.1 lysine transporter LysE [Bacteroidia bacterium]NNJ82253.1 lysine transporter LysE [Flavobacteriaceae bacterium]NNK54961.1 lysine transporter LysE [Flavobacteriaceae bacterium]